MVSERTKIVLQNWITYGEFFAENLDPDERVVPSASDASLIINILKDWQEKLYSEAEKQLRKNMEIKWGRNYLEYHMWELPMQRAMR